MADVTQKSFWPVMQQVANTQGWTAVGQLGDQGYWNQFPDYTPDDAQYVGGLIANYQSSQDSGGFLGDIGSSLTNLVGNPFGNMAFTTPDSTIGKASALAGGAYLGAGALGGSEAGGGGGMWDWLDTIDGGDELGGLSDGELADIFAGGTGNGDVLMGGGSAASGGTSIWDKLVDKGLNYAQDYLTNKLNGSGGSVLDQIASNPLQAGVNFTPFLLSAYLANQQRGDLDSVLNQVNPEAYQRSVLNPYDLQTSQARAALQNDMGLRGVAGSSFGNQQLNNFDYMHGIERGDLASKAALASAGLQGQLINQRNLNSNLLLGSGLNATAKLFQPKQQMFPFPVPQTPQPKPVGDNLLGDLFNLGKSALGSGGYFGGLFG